MRRCPPELHGEALLLLARRNAADDVAAPSPALQQHDAARFPLDGLLIAEGADRLVGAAYFSIQPGRMALVWPPVVDECADGQRVGDALLDEICRRVDECGCKLAQCLLEPASPDGCSMERHGFARLTELLYAERLLEEPLPPCLPNELRWIAYDREAAHARFAALLEATYAGTFDCPELNGLRSADESLAGHGASGRFDPRLWRLYETAGSDAGLILLADHPGARAWEVVYMGVVPPMRGRGVGREMLARALHDARAAGCEAVLLAVDVRNRSARRLYEQLGFVELCRRVIHVRLGR
ncbi:MAG TPA: GNAT family N-acetyltransferase [Planctomycetaceae bacterium]|nr:GNAT family N-acetyltransferase [Planctomycetaceae bacterium]